jgi:hypothetical protein
LTYMRQWASFQETFFLVRDSRFMVCNQQKSTWTRMNAGHNVWAHWSYIHPLKWQFCVIHGTVFVLLQPDGRFWYYCWQLPDSLT